MAVTQSDIRREGSASWRVQPRAAEDIVIDLRETPPAVSTEGSATNQDVALPWIAKHSRPSKRVFDLAVSIFLLLLLAPVFLLVALAIKLDDGGPVFYRQRRVGFRGRPFRIIKFRSMNVGAERLRDHLLHRNVTDGLLFKLHDDPRVTRVGRVIRRLSIDELPQLWNVVRGEMSLVGPRPLLAEPSDFAPSEAIRHHVLPGITGIWQVSGCNDLSYCQMITLDLAYVAGWSMLLDVVLLVRTVPALVRRRGPA